MNGVGPWTVPEAAVACFSRKGFYGTTTQEIAEHAGISQPCVYRLFESKQALFAAAAHLVSELMASALARYVTDTSPSSSSPVEALHTARMAYSAFTADHSLLMNANCAVDEPLDDDAVLQCYARQVDLVGELLDSDEEAIRQWFGAGMPGNVVTALQLSDIDEPWARTLKGRLSGKLGRPGSGRTR